MADEVKDPQPPQEQEVYDAKDTVSYEVTRHEDYLIGALAHMKKTMRDKLDTPTRLVDETIEYNNSKLNEMDRGDQTVQFMGEVFHMCLMHPERKRTLTGGLHGLATPMDIAASLATYHMMAHRNREISDKFVQPKHLGFEENLSVEEYFDLVMADMKKKGIDPNAFTPQEAGQGGQGGGEGEGEGKEGEGQGQQEKGDSPYQKLLKAMGAKGGDKYDQDHSGWGQVSETTQEYMKGEFVRALESAKARGTLPGGMERLLEMLLKEKKEKWYDKLTKIIGTKMATDKWRKTFKRPSRRYWYPWRGRVKIKRGQLTLALDTSGSIGEDELAIFLNRMYSISKIYGAPFEVIICDAEIHGVERIVNKRDIEKMKIKGGGGTSSLPVFEHLEKRHTDMLIYLTDLYIDFPTNPPKYQVIWAVINNEGAKAPFGETVHITIDEDESGRRR